MTQIQQISHSTWDVCCHPLRHAKGSLVALGSLAIAAGLTAGLVLATTGGSEQIGPTGSLAATTGDASSTVSEPTTGSTSSAVTPAVTASTPSTIYFDPAAGLFDTRAAAVVGTGMAPSLITFDPAAGFSVDGEWVADPAAGLALYPRTVRTADTSVDSAAIYFDPAAGLFDTRAVAVVGTGMVPSLITFDPAAGMAVYPTS